MNRFNIKYEVKTKPYPHQIEATRFILENDYCALFDEQGLGKTKIVIDAIVTELKQKKINGCLVVSPKTLIKNWENEVKKHSFLKPLNLIGSKREKGYKFLSYANIYLTNYEQIISELERIKDFLNINNFAIVLDESQRIKNPLAKTTNCILEISKLSNKKIIITGTPIANKPEDIWTQFYFLDKGKLLGNSFNHFKNKYISDAYDENSYSKLREKISIISLRRLKDDVLELPKKIYKDIYIELKGLQKEKYERLKQSLIVEIKDFEGEISIDENDYFIKKLLRLTQLASHPFLLDKSYKEIPSRIIALDELINEIISRKEKVIIWSSFVDNIRLIRNRYKKLGSLYLFGAIPIDDRNRFIELFQTDEKYRVMVANPAAAREGITLSAANNAIYYDRNFSLVDYIQSQDRIHRISQEKQCYIFKIIAKNTIDEFIDDKIYSKQSIASYLQGDANKIKEKENKLSKEEIIEILGG